MFAVIAGIVLALFFLGLPLGIIALFVMSIVDQKSASTRKDRKLTAIGQTIVVRFPEQQPPPRPTTKRREQLIVWRNPNVKRYMSTRGSGK